VAKLNQIIAVLSGKKSQSAKDITAIYKLLQKPALFEGISRTYQPLDEDGETQPPESKNVQYTVPQSITAVREAISDLLNVAATQDWANCQAKATVRVDDVDLLTDVPVTHLLFLEKQLNDLHTFVTHMPVLDPAERWMWDQAADCYSSQPFITNRTKKTPRSHVKYEATEEHPAQTEMYMEDVKVGEWRTVKFSGAIAAQDKNNLLRRIRKLQEAIKFAREEANNAEVEEQKTADRIFDYIFEKN